MLLVSNGHLQIYVNVSLLSLPIIYSPCDSRSAPAGFRPTRGDSYVHPW